MNSVPQLCTTVREMPRACPVESHVRRYTDLRATLKMPRACPVESHVRRYTESKPNALDATGLPRGVSRSLLFSWEREPCYVNVKGYHAMSVNGFCFFCVCSIDYSLT
jgi:hypothetical protein